jgi:hypothetical protein
MQGLDIKPAEGRERARHEHQPGSGRIQPRTRKAISDAEVVKILGEVDRLLGRGENLECVNLLRALRDNMQAVRSPHLQLLVPLNLGILYYQVGFLEEAHLELAAATCKYLPSHTG